jgi:hypothetical protein
MPESDSDYRLCCMTGHHVVAVADRSELDVPTAIARGKAVGRMASISGGTAVKLRPGFRKRSANVLTPGSASETSRPAAERRGGILDHQAKPGFEVHGSRPSPG